MAKFFIDRPVFAIVFAIVTVILGAVAIPNLPIATYPEVVPPLVQITANFRGANAQDLERTVAQPIEQQLVALDGMLYFFSRSSNDGVLTMDARRGGRRDRRAITRRPHTVDDGGGIQPRRDGRVAPGDGASPDARDATGLRAIDVARAMGANVSVFRA